ncbi:MAG: hypothetical protein Q9160_001702, partial [Pyrenula sp. 1 TL-2023]
MTGSPPKGSPSSNLVRWLSEHVRESPWSARSTALDKTTFESLNPRYNVQTALDETTFESLNRRYNYQTALEFKSYPKPIGDSRSKQFAETGWQSSTNQNRQTSLTTGKQQTQHYPSPFERGVERGERNTVAATNLDLAPPFQQSFDYVFPELSSKKHGALLQQKSSSPRERPVPSADSLASSGSVPSIQRSPDLIPAQSTLEKDQRQLLAPLNSKFSSLGVADGSHSLTWSSNAAITDKKRNHDSEASENVGKDTNSPFFNRDAVASVLATPQGKNDGSEDHGQVFASGETSHPQINDRQYDSKSDCSSSVESPSKPADPLKESRQPILKHSVEASPDASPTPVIVAPSTDDLESHKKAFYTILHAYIGHQRGVNDSDKVNRNVSITSTSNLQEPVSSCPSKHARTSRARGSHGDDHQSDSSDGDDRGRRRNQKHRKASQRPQLPNRRFACPFHKYDPGSYGFCREWGVTTIENVRRHVLGPKHRTFFEMRPDKVQRIRLLPPSKTGAEERWHAIYRSSFDIANDSNYMKPSPYIEEPMTSAPGPDCFLQFSLSSPVEDFTVASPAQSTMHARSNINPDASAYADEIQRLTEQYNQRCLEVRLWRGQERANLQATHSRLQALDLGERRLTRDLHLNLLNLRTGMEQGLSLHAQLRRVPLVLTARNESQLGADVSLEVPASSQVGEQGRAGSDDSQPSLEVSNAPTEPQPSVANDSG